MKTQQQIDKEMDTLNNMGNVEKVRWFMVKPENTDNWKTYHDVPIDSAQKMANYCFNNRIHYEVEFYTEED